MILCATSSRVPCSSSASTRKRIFPNCPRYLHKMKLVEHSVYAPRPEYTPPVPAWKTFDVFRDALPRGTE